MKNMVFIITFILTLVIFICPAQAGMKKLAQTGLQFLKVDVGTRASAMGGSYSMIGEDATALFYNPAGIARMRYNFNFFITRTQWIADINYNAGGLVKNLGIWGKIGFSFIFSDYGEIIGTRVASTQEGYIRTGKLDVGAYAIGVAFARELTEKFSVGGQIKYVAQHLGSNIIHEGGEEIENKVSGLAYDVGTIFYPGFKSFRMGMFIRNFSPQFKYEQFPFQLPLTFSIGFAMDMMDLLGENENSLLLSLDANHPRDYSERIHLGTEYTFKDMFSLRLGYKFNYDIESLTAGVGFKFNFSKIDVSFGYSYSEMEFFDGVNRLDFIVSF